MEEKTWADAEAHCQSLGGHLASVQTAEEHEELTLLAGHRDIWLGGRDQDEEGIWKWADGSYWGYWFDYLDLEYDDWSQKFESHGERFNCLIMKSQRGIWADSNCNASHPFICQHERETCVPNGNLTQLFTKDNLTISSITVKYRHSSISQEVLASMIDKKMSGFRLNWFFQDSNVSRHTEKKPELPIDWKLEPEVAQFQEEYLVRMVQLASRARKNNMTREDITNLVMTEKAKLIIGGSITYTSVCSGGWVKNGYNSMIFNNILKI